MRLDKKEALKLLRKSSLHELQEMAYAFKKELHPGNITTFIVDRNINYTNVCWVDCDFCAFYRHQKDKDAYMLNFGEIDRKIEELLDIGGTQILFQGGVHPKLKIDYYENLVEHITEKFPSIDIHGFSAIEINYIAKVSDLSVYEVLERLKNKGLFSMPGAGAEILNDAVRDKIAPKKLNVKDWLEVHAQAHKLNMLTSATMMFGTLESDEDIIEHLLHLRDLQDKTNGFSAFILWSFQSKNTRLLKKYPSIAKQSSNRYLRLLAISRLFLDNIKNIQSSWVTQGSHIGQLALMYGANDLGSTMMEENVVKSAGAAFRMSKEEMIGLIRDIGEIPAQRNTAYERLHIFQ